HVWRRSGLAILQVRLFVLSACRPRPPPTRGVATLPLHDALPISAGMYTTEMASTSTGRELPKTETISSSASTAGTARMESTTRRSEEHTSELQSRFDLVCRLLLEKNNRREAWTQSGFTRARGNRT